MDVMHERVAGLDVHKETVVACVRIMAGGKAHRECRTFDTNGALRPSIAIHVAAVVTWHEYWRPHFVAGRVYLDDPLQMFKRLAL